MQDTVGRADPIETDADLFGEEGPLGPGVVVGAVRRFSQ